MRHIFSRHRIKWDEKRTEMMKHRTRHLNSPSLFLAEITRCDRVREPPDAVGVVNYETRRAGRGAQKVPSYFF